MHVCVCRHGVALSTKVEDRAHPHVLHTRYDPGIMSKSFDLHSYWEIRPHEVVLDDGSSVVHTHLRIRCRIRCRMFLIGGLFEGHLIRMSVAGATQTLDAYAVNFGGQAGSGDYDDPEKDPALLAEAEELEKKE